MADLAGLLNLLAPFFGLIGLGFLSGKVARRLEAGLAWMTGLLWLIKTGRMPADLFPP